jgi:hypothetical protein
VADEIDVDLEQLGRLAKSASSDFANLAHLVKGFGDQHGAVKRFNVDLKESRALLRAAGGSVDIVKTALKAAGVAGRDVTLVVKQLNRDIDDSRKAAMGFSGYWQRALHAAFGPHAIRQANSFFDKLKSAGGFLLGGAAGIAGKALSAGEGIFEKLLEVGQYKEASQKGLEYILGKREEMANMTLKEAAEQRVKNAQAENDARQLMADALELAQQAPIADREILQAVKDFATQGYKPEQAKKLVQYMADQQSKFLEEPEVRQNFVTAFSRMKGRGVATNRDLESLRIAKFQTEDVLRELLNQPGMKEVMAGYKKGKYKVSAEDLEAAKTEGEGASAKELQAIASLKKILAGSQVSSMTLANAALDSLNRDRSRAGELARTKSQTTLVGAVNNAENVFENLLLKMDIATSNGGKALAGFLRNFTDVVGHSQVLQDTITGLFDAVFEPMSKFTKEDIAGVIRDVGKVGEEVIGVIKQAWLWLRQLLDAKPGEFMRNVKDVLIEVGTYIGKGIFQGAASGVTGAFGLERYSSTAQGSSAKAWSNAWEDTGGALWDGVSGRFRSMWNRRDGAEGQEGGMSLAPPMPAESGDGYSSDEPPAWVSKIPHAAEGGTVAKPTLLVAGESGVEDIVPRGRRGGGQGYGAGGPMLVVQGPLVVVQGDARDPDALASAIDERLEERLVNIARRFAMERS